MNSRPDEAPEGEPSWAGFEAHGRLARRKGLVPPMVSVAMVVATVVGLAGIGIGYRLGQAAPTDSSATAIPTDAVPTAPETTALDLQSDAVSPRLQTAFAAYDDPPGAWAICYLADAIHCEPVRPRLSVSSVVHHTFDFTNEELDTPGRPVLAAGHLVLVADLGEGSVVQETLIAVDPTDDRPLTPIDPARAGVDYFDLGILDGGSYGVMLGFVPQTVGVSAPVLDSYLVGFGAAG
jgi:hypothetical protein